jgi:hypothetical protein
MRGADLSGAICRLADLSDCDLTGAQASRARFERATLAWSKLVNLSAPEAVFEFCDLRNTLMQDAVFHRVNCIGALLAGARALSCDFSGSDFYWAEVDGFEQIACRALDVRWPTAVIVAHAPGSVKPPDVRRVPLSRAPATREGRERLLVHCVDDAR